MLKKQTKLAIIAFLMIALCSTFCFATDGEAVVTSADNTTAVDDISTESENQVTDEGTAENGNEVTSEETTETVEPELIESDLYLAGDSITVSDYVDGNVYVMAENVTVSGKIGGDLFVLANTLTLTEDSYAYGNLYVCANETKINGIVCDLYAFCNNLEIGASGIVLRDSRTATKNISLNGNVGRNTFINTNTISMADTAHIYGNLNYSSKEAIVVPSGAVDGSIDYNEPTMSASNANVKNIILNYALDFIYALVYTLVVFGLMLLVAPKFTTKLHEITKTKWLAALGIGALVTLLIPVIAVLLVFTVVGTPLSFAVIGLYLLVLSITFALTAIGLSKLLASKVKALSKFNNVFALIIVTLVLWGLTQIPFYVGLVIKLLITVFGFGIFTLSVFKKENNENNEIKEN